jgi:hypothetical protein
MNVGRLKEASRLVSEIEETERLVARYRDAESILIGMPRCLIQLGDAPADTVFERDTGAGKRSFVGVEMRGVIVE